MEFPKNRWQTNRSSHTPLQGKNTILDYAIGQGRRAQLSATPNALDRMQCETTITETSATYRIE